MSKIDAYVIEAQRLAHSARAGNTERAYRGDVAAYDYWCAFQGVSAYPPTVENVTAYLAWMASKASCRPATVRRRLCGLKAVWDGLYGHGHAARDPEVARVVEGIRRTYIYQRQQAVALTRDQVRQMAEACDVTTLRGARDRALLLVMVAGGLRRSEAVGLRVEDVQFDRGGMRMYLRRTKTDQRGEGRWVGVRPGRSWKTCATRSVQQWLKISKIQSGWLWRSFTRGGHLTLRPPHINSISDILRGIAQRAGVPIEGISSHSARATLITSLLDRGESETAISRVTGHRDLGMIGRYDRGRRGDWRPDLGL